MSTPARILMVTGDTSPSAPSAGQILFYAKTDGVFYSKNSANVEVPLAGGTVASVNASGGTTGMSFSGGPVTGSGTLTLGGVLGVANGGTGSTTQAGAAAAILPSQTGNAGKFLTTDGTNISWATVSGTGTVTSVGLSSANAAISVSGSPVTTSGTITVTANTFTTSAPGVVPASGGGTTNFLRADGTWATPGGAGTVTSVAIAGDDGVFVSGSPITSSGTITIALNDITPTSVSSSGTVTGSNLSGTNTGDQTITLTGDVTGSGTGSFAATLANTGVVSGVYGSSTQVPVFNVDSKGRITNVSNVTISAGSGTVTSVSSSGGSTGLTLTTTNPTTTPSLTLAGTLALANGGTGATSAAGARTSLGATTVGGNLFTLTNPSAVTFLRVNADNTVSALDAATFRTAIGAGTGNGNGTVTSVTVNGTSGRITSSGSPVTTSGTITLDLATTTVTPNTYGSATDVPVFTVDAYGRITNVTNTPITGGGSSTETVVFKYTSGGSGNLTAGDAIVSQTANVTATITDGANCIVTFAFTGKSAPPTSITIYGQNYSANTFSIVTPPSVGAALANYKIAGGGTSASPDLANGIFSATNVITLQLRMSDTGASSTIGNRAHALVRFGF